MSSPQQPDMQPAAPESTLHQESQSQDMHPQQAQHVQPALSQAGDSAAAPAPSPEQVQLSELGEDALAPVAEMPIRLPAFEGPLDLLLFLIRRNEIDIYDIPIESVTKQYMEVIHSMKELNLEVAGDFFVMAATLMYIKSRMLLPTNEQAVQQQEEEEDDADPRWELVQQLLEYKKYKEAAYDLQSLIEHQQDFLERYYQPAPQTEVEQELEPADKIELWNTFNKVLRRLAERIVKGEIQDEEISITQSMEFIIGIIDKRESFRFTEILAGRRLTVPFLVSTFLAILELTRLKRLYIVQDNVFGEIECSRRDNPLDEGEDVTEEEQQLALITGRKKRADADVGALPDALSGSGEPVHSGDSGASGDSSDSDNAPAGDGAHHDSEDDFQPGEDDFNWEDFGGAPVSKSDADDDADAGDKTDEIDAEDSIAEETEGDENSDDSDDPDGTDDSNNSEIGNGIEADDDDDNDWDDFDGEEEEDGSEDNDEDSENTHPESDHLSTEDKG